MRQVKHIVIHCSATRAGQNVTIAEITCWHKERGFTDIGYHYVIYLDGSIHKGRDIDRAGAHVAGHNTDTAGICYIGGLDAAGKPKDTRTPEQKASLMYLIEALKEHYPAADVLGHRDFPGVAKDCPCFDAKNEYKNL